jgi:hypothetical protein
MAATVCLPSAALTKTWSSSDLLQELLHRALDHLGDDLGRLARLGRLFSAILRSFSTSSAGTSADDSAAGFMAATCIATSLAATASPLELDHHADARAVQVVGQLPPPA